MAALPAPFNSQPGNAGGFDSGPFRFAVGVVRSFNPPPVSNAALGGGLPYLRIDFKSPPEYDCPPAPLSGPYCTLSL